MRTKKILRIPQTIRSFSPLYFTLVQTPALKTNLSLRLPETNVQKCPSNIEPFPLEAASQKTTPSRTNEF